ncbi:Rv3235 family protein [Nocardia sp. NPDC127579]|uniref:Rv3235 family protein n=1 Tax=Nocardia sp. NPDC127579 TaxID=3345402 RepID=UPI003635695E
MGAGRKWVRAVPEFEPPLLGCGCGAVGPERGEVWVDPPVVRGAACSVEREVISPRLRRLRAREAAPVVGEARSDAMRFADRALRVALEVLDQRRPVTQLRGMVSQQVLEAIRTMVVCDSAPGRGLGAATLDKVDVFMIDVENAEICARYERGRRQRRLAIAARARFTRGVGWQLTVFRLMGL